MLRGQNTLREDRNSARGSGSAIGSKMGSQFDMKNPLADLQSRLMNTPTEASAINALAFIHGRAAAGKEMRSVIAQMFTDQSIPDLIFGICRRYPACITYVSSIMTLCADITDFGKRALRNRTVVAFLRFLTSNESLAGAFEHILIGNAHAIRSFSASEGEKVLTDVMGQLRGAARPYTIVSLLRIVARLSAEPPNSSQERNGLLQSFLLLMSDADVLNVLTDGFKGDAPLFLDNLLTILRAGGQVESSTVPVDLTCILSHILIEDGCKGAAEDAKVPEWDTVVTRLIAVMTGFPMTDNRRQSPFIPPMWASAANNAKTLSSSLSGTLLQCAMQWMQKGWMVGSVVQIANAVFSHDQPSVVELRNAVVILLHACAFKSVHPQLEKLNIRAIRDIFHRFVTNASPERMSADEKTICEYWICFVHMATYLRLAPVQEFFRPLGEYVASGKIRERTFTEMTRWPRNDGNDAKKLAQCQAELGMLLMLEQEEARVRLQYDVVFDEIAQFYLQFKSTLSELEKDPRFIQKFHEWKLAVGDDRNLFAGKMSSVESSRADLISYFKNKIEESERSFKDSTLQEKKAHVAEVDGIVWDADELATKNLTHTSRLAQIENAYEKETREVTAMSQWKLGICDQILNALRTIEGSRNLRLLNLEKEEERQRGTAVISSGQWALLRHDHDAARENLIRQEASERKALWEDPSALALEQFRINREKIFDFEQLHMEYTIDIEEDRGREFVQFYHAFFIERPDLTVLVNNYTLSSSTGKGGSRSPLRTPVARSLSPPHINTASSSNAMTSTSSSSHNSNSKGVLSPTRLLNHTNSHSNGRLSPREITSGSPSFGGSGRREGGSPMAGSAAVAHRHGGSPPSTPPAPTVAVLTPRTNASILHLETQSRQQYASREREWRKYYIESSDVERRKVYYQQRFDEVQRMQTEMLEDGDRIRITKEWAAGIVAIGPFEQFSAALTQQAAAAAAAALANANSIHLQQQLAGANGGGIAAGGFRSLLDKSSGPLDQKLKHSLSLHGPPSITTAAGGSVVVVGGLGNLPAVLHTSSVFPTSSGLFNNSSTPANTAATSQEIALQRELRSVQGYILKTTIKFRAADIQEMEQHRRARIINLYKIFMNEMYSSMTLHQFKIRIQWALMDEESFARYKEACQEQVEFSQLLMYKAQEEQFTLPLRHIHEIERQLRSQVDIDERIAYQQMQVHRPRGRKFRPLREVETEKSNLTPEPGLVSRVKAWIREGTSKTNNHQNASHQGNGPTHFPCFTEVFPPIVHVLSTDLKIPLPLLSRRSPHPQQQPEQQQHSSSNNNGVSTANGLSSAGGQQYGNNNATSDGLATLAADGSPDSRHITGNAPLSLVARENENSIINLAPSSGAPSAAHLRSSPDLSRHREMNQSMQGNLTHVNSTAGVSFAEMGPVVASPSSGGAAAVITVNNIATLGLSAAGGSSAQISVTMLPTASGSGSNNNNNSGNVLVVPSLTANNAAVSPSQQQQQFGPTNSVSMVANNGTNNSFSHASPTTINASQYASRLRGEVKVERDSQLLIQFLQRLEVSRRDEVVRCEETARSAFVFQHGKVLAHRYAIMEEKETLNPKLRRKDSRKYTK